MGVQERTQGISTTIETSKRASIHPRLCGDVQVHLYPWQWH